MPKMAAGELAWAVSRSEASVREAPSTPGDTRCGQSCMLAGWCGESTCGIKGADLFSHGRLTYNYEAAFARFRTWGIC